MSRKLGSTSTNTDGLIELKFQRSDGDSSRRPSNVDPTPERDGTVNYHRLVHLPEVPSVSWRHKTAVAVAAHLGKPSKHILLMPHICSLSSCTAPEQYIFDAFPDQYAFYDHNKGSVDGPRHDLYLYGGFLSSYTW